MVIGVVEVGLVGVVEVGLAVTLTLGNSNANTVKKHLAAGASQWERRIMYLIAGRQLMHAKFMHELCSLLIHISIY
jgi:hypothetical protein